MVDRRLSRVAVLSPLLGAMGLNGLAFAQASGTVECFGAGVTNAGWPNFGQSTMPANLAPCTAIAGGWMHTVVLRTDGIVLAWGSNFNNQNTVVNQSVIPGTLGTCTAVGAGFYHTLAVRTNQSVAAWGDNTYAQTVVPPSLLATKVAGGGFHSVALRNTGTVACWGAGSGATGHPHYGQSTVPSGLGTVSAITAGGYHTAVIRAADSSVVCWGSNN